MANKYIVVVGGVISGTGKGVAAASVGLLMRLRGHTVQIIKFDPYLNVNAGILAPSQHGECYLCDDGTETDLDLGHYERIAGVTVSGRNICTSGTLYKELIQEQESGKYLGQTVQIIPHLTNKIHQRLNDLGKETDIVIAEIGGTVGDIESAAFFEAIRQFKMKKGIDMLVVMVAPVLWVPTIREYKTKPLQNAVKELQRHGLQPDVILCRAEKDLHHSILDKVASLTNVSRECVFDAPDVESIYQVPIEFYERHVDDLCVDLLHMKRTYCGIHKHRKLVERDRQGCVDIGVFGKYTNADEAYMSIKEALYHAGMSEGSEVNIHWIKSEDVEKSADISEFFNGLHGAIVPGGFDSRGVEGKIRAVQYIRENGIPFLGICLGLQCAVIEHARNVGHLPSANSEEFDKDCSDPVVCYMKGQETLATKSASMRLGAYDCELTKGSISIELYGKKLISERHRHRLEVNPKYTGMGFNVTGTNPQTGLIEIMELDRSVHPFFIGTQAHPEFKSKLSEPAPLFKGLVGAAVKRRDSGGKHGELLA